MKNSKNERPSPQAGTLQDSSTETAGGILAKLRADIGFLQERIHLMQSQSKPNTAVLQTYQTMLTRREMVLASLLKSSTSKETAGRSGGSA